MPNLAAVPVASPPGKLLGQRAQELGVLAVAIEHLGTPIENFTLSASGIATLERMAERLKADLDRMLMNTTKAGDPQRRVLPHAESDPAI